jgi:hypothetical protein
MKLFFAKEMKSRREMEMIPRREKKIEPRRVNY